MNYTRYVFSAIGLFLFISLYEMLIHDFILMDMYLLTESIWRNFAEMESNIGLSLCYQLALSAWSAYIFTQFYKEGGIKNGLRFGLLLGVFSGILTASWYLWLPVSVKLGFLWFIFSMGEGIGGGCILALIYRPSGNFLSKSN